MIRRSTPAQWARADVHASRQQAGVGDQSNECPNGEDNCPDEHGLPCYGCLIDGAGDSDDREVATDGGTAEAGAEIVYVVRYSSRKSVYHTDEECRYLYQQADRKPQHWQKETAEAWDLTPCSECSPGGDADV